MDTTTIVLSLIGALGTVSSIFFAVLAFRRNERGDQKQVGKNEGVLISDIGYIKSTLDRIEKSLDKLEEGYKSLEGRVIKLESESKNLTIKIDDHIRNKSLHGKGVA
jgi:septal ring factor EnvC (AmiA/AmiB activator)